MGHIHRHVLAPRAATQDAMNLMFRGEPFELAERYTDMTKVSRRNIQYFYKGWRRKLILRQIDLVSLRVVLFHFPWIFFLVLSFPTDQIFRG